MGNQFFYPFRLRRPPCGQYMREGWCRKKENCYFNHPDDCQAAAKYARGETAFELNSDGLPLRPGSPICHSYRDTGRCRFGAFKCSFHHPEPEAPDSSKRPETMQEWADRQDVLFVGLPELQENWIRVQSQSAKPGDTYYVRITDMYATWNLQECKA